jgi:hypothetical protein
MFGMEAAAGSAGAAAATDPATGSASAAGAAAAGGGGVPVVPAVYRSAAVVQEGKGIVPRACEEIFAALALRRAQNDIESEVSVSYVEVYGDEVSDLLKHGARCGQSKVAAQQYVLSGAAERVVYSIEDVSEVLKIGNEHSNLSFCYR